MLTRLVQALFQNRIGFCFVFFFVWKLRKVVGGDVDCQAEFGVLREEINVW